MIKWDEITTQAPTKTRKCWIAFDLLYSGRGPTEELAISDMKAKKARHLKAMADIPKVNDGSSDTN